MCFSCFETAWAGKNIRCPVKDDRDLEVFEVCGGAAIRRIDGLCGFYGSDRGRRVGRNIFRDLYKLLLKRLKSVLSGRRIAASGIAAKNEVNTFLTADRRSAVKQLNKMMKLFY